jgi:hypothetical protein
MDNDSRDPGGTDDFTREREGRWRLREKRGEMEVKGEKRG